MPITPWKHCTGTLVSSSRIQNRGTRIGAVEPQEPMLKNDTGTELKNQYRTNTKKYQWVHASACKAIMHTQKVFFLKPWRTCINQIHSHLFIWYFIPLGYCTKCMHLFFAPIPSLDVLCCLVINRFTCGNVVTVHDHLIFQYLGIDPQDYTDSGSFLLGWGGMGISPYHPNPTERAESQSKFTPWIIS